LAVKLAAFAFFLVIGAGVGHGGASSSDIGPLPSRWPLFDRGLAYQPTVDEVEDPSEWRPHAVYLAPSPAEDRVDRGPCDTEDIHARFKCGFRDRAEAAPWLLALEEHVAGADGGVIFCESRWRLDPGNPSYLGLGQFAPRTWRVAARHPDADPFDPYEQGWAVANNIVIADPAWQWPVCWHRGA
jgi:hypothetical protein